MDKDAGSIFAVFDIDGVVRDVAGSYRRALADTVEQFTDGQYRPTMAAIDALKGEGCWNNDWDASEELIYRYYEGQSQSRDAIHIDYDQLVKFFQSRYFGDDFSGYIQNEPLLMSQAYLASLTQAGIGWGFFSGATRRSALYVLEGRLQLPHPILVGMEDAPGKPDPTGLRATVSQLQVLALETPETPEAPETPETPETPEASITVFYIGDTVADIQTAVKAQTAYPGIRWVGIGVMPPHAQGQVEYRERLQKAGAIAVLNHVEDLTPPLMQTLSRSLPLVPLDPSSSQG